MFTSVNKIVYYGTVNTTNGRWTKMFPESIFWSVHNCLVKNHLTPDEISTLNNFFDVDYWNKYHQVKLLNFQKDRYDNSKREYL